MSLTTEQERRKDWAERVTLHLLDGVNIIEIGEMWGWEYFAEWDGHRVAIDGVKYHSHESCINAVEYLMRNSPKRGYAQNMASAGAAYMRNR